MIHVECAAPIHASRAAAWRLLRDKMEAPQRFLARVTGCEVVARNEDEVVRRLTFDDGNAVTERVTLMPEEGLIFRFVDHPKFEGEIRNVLFETGDALWLSIGFQGRAREGIELGRQEFEQLREGFARAVLAAARQIEELEREALETT